MPYITKKNRNKSQKHKKRNAYKYCIFSICLFIPILILSWYYYQKQHAYRSTPSSSFTSIKSYNSFIEFSEYTKGNPSKQNSLMIKVLKKDLNLKYVQSPPHENKILELRENKTADEKEELDFKLVLLMDQLNIIKEELETLFINYNEEVMFYINFCSVYYYHPFRKLHKNFPKYLFKFHKVTLITIAYISKLDRILTITKLKGLQKEIFYLFTLENILKIYYECKSGLERQTELFMRETFIDFTENPIKYVRWLKGKVLYKQVLNLTFKEINFEDNKSTSFLKGFLKKTHFDSVNVWTIREYKMIKYYLLLESFHLLFYLFKLDHNGYIIKMRVWYDYLLDEDNEFIQIQGFKNKLDQFVVLCKDLLKLWINDDSEYNLDILIKKYVDIIIVGSDLDYLLS